MRAMMLLAAIWATGTVWADEPVKLTPERYYASPSLNGKALRGLQIAPDGSRVTFLQAGRDDAERLDLWEFDLGTGERRLLLDARDLLGGAVETLSSEELARRERARIRSSGIVSYQWSADAAALLIPLSGDIFLYDLANRAPRRLTETKAAELDPRLSPDGSMVAFVRDADLWILTIADGEERRLTEDGGEGISNGLAEFVAQEEMDRSRGYWWSPDSRSIAFQRTDERGVGVITRLEADGEGVRTVKQRYPRSGEPNAEVALHVAAVDGSSIREIMSFGQNAYLARVTWHDGDVIVQRQNRDQTQLEILRVNPRDAMATRLLEEIQEPWVNLHDDLHFLSDGRFVWTSERSGERRVYLYEADGGKARTLTRGDGLVDGVACVDEAGERVFFHGYEDEAATIRALYAVSFKGSKNWTALSEEAGWRSARFASDCSIYAASSSDVRTPPRTGLYAPDGGLKFWLEENALDADHPFAPYAGPDLEPFTKDDGLEYLTGQIRVRGGERLNYRMLKPRACTSRRKCPAVVYVYGGPHVQLVTDQWSVWPRMLADRGYVVFTLDNRGSARRGLKFEAEIHETMAGIEVADQATGAEWLAERKFVDGNRIGVYGWSYGGYMTLHMLAQKPELFAAGVSGAPVTRWELYDTHYTERYMETPEANPEGYERAAVFAHLDGLDDPLLLIHGMADDNVIFDNSIALIQALQERGVLFEFIAYPGEPHGLRKRENRVHRDRAIFDFFDRRLKSD